MKHSKLYLNEIVYFECKKNVINNKDNMVYTYQFTRPLNDMEAFYSYLNDDMPLVKSVTADSHVDINHYSDNHDITVYTDVELTSEQQTQLQNLVINYPNPMHEIDVNSFRKVSTVNSTTIPLYPNCAFEGHWEDISNYSTMSIWVKATKDSALNGLEIHYSADAIETDSMRPITVIASRGTRNQFVVTCRYFKIKYINGSEFSNIKIQVMFHHHRNKAIGTRLSAELYDSFDCEVVRSVVNGRLENGTYIPVDITSQGYLKTSIQEPLSTFGCVTIANNTPVFQYDFVYSKNEHDFDFYTSGSGSITNTSNSLLCYSGSNVNSSAIYVSKKNIKYRSGQGTLCRFTAVYDQPSIGNKQFVGFGNFETMLGYGYDGSNFGIIYAPKNKREKCTIIITEPSNDNQNMALTLAGQTYTIPVTNNGSKEATAWEISQFAFSNTYPTWELSATGSNIDVFCLQSMALSNNYQISFPSSGNGNITRDVEGYMQSNYFVPQSTWNIDTMDGSGSSRNPSKVLINPQKGNLYHIKFQYQGYGFIEFGLENPDNAEQVPVHRDYYANKHTIPSLANPHLSFIMSSTNTTASNNIAVSSGCCVGFTQGEIHKTGYKYVITKQKSNIGTSLTPIFSIRPSLSYHNRPNLLEIVLYQMNVTNLGDEFVTLCIIINGTLDNKTNFANIDYSNTYIEKDETCEVLTGGKCIYSLTIPPKKSKVIDLKSYDIILNAHSWITIIAEAVNNTTDVLCSLLVQEDD
jgi:hypothetical protein